MRGRSVAVSTLWPLNFRMMSPGWMPALSAGPPGSTLETSAPCAFGNPSESATSFVTSPIATAIRPRTTLPTVFN